MKLKAFAAALICMALAESCGKPQPELTEKKCAEIIFQMHKADAIISLKKYNDRDLKNDSLSYYNYIFQQQGITKQEFIDAINWYIVHPEQYKDLYDKVLKLVEKNNKEEEARISSLDSTISTNVGKNFWNQSTSFRLPEDGETNPVTFDIPATEAGIYILTADIRMFSDDGTKNPRMTIIANYEDGSSESNSNNGFEKDGNEHTISVKIKTDNGKKLKKLTGWLLDHSDGTTKKHLTADNIKLEYQQE